MSERDAEMDLAMCNNATPGPWAWFGYKSTKSIYLATVKLGRRFVMQFERWGMQCAAPTFQQYYDKTGKKVNPGDDDNNNGIMKRVDEFLPKDEDRIFKIDHPDAIFIAESRNVLPYWIQRAQKAEAEVERLKAEQHEDMELMAESVDVEALAIKAIKKLQNERDEARKEVKELKKELAQKIDIDFEKAIFNA